MKAVIFDIDGTIADKGNRNPFDWDNVGEDIPHKDIMRLAQILSECNYIIILVSGRDESCRKETKKWLKKYGFEYEELFMRPKNNFEKDFIIKERIYKENIEPKYKVHYVFDDRNQTVNQWRKMGLRCLQVSEGNF